MKFLSRSISAAEVVLLLLAVSSWTASAQTPGHIENFQQLESAEDSITLEWTLVKGDVDITSYSLYTVELAFDTSVRCLAEHCTSVVPYLDPCSLYHFDLTPHFGAIDGDKVSTTGTTQDQLPGPPLDLTVKDSADPGVTVSWNPPEENPHCVESYQVCARLEGETEGVCIQTNNTEAYLDFLQMCSHYYISVGGVTPLGTVGDLATVEENTPEGVPGPPQNLQVSETGPNYIKITYCDVIVNPLCVAEFAISWNDHLSLVPKGNGKSNCSPAYENTISPLSPCTNYTIEVSANNPSGIFGDPTSVEAVTDDAAPLRPSFVTTTPSGTDEIEVIWGGNFDNNCAYSIDICWSEETLQEGDCVNVIIDNADGSGNYSITHLTPCARYEISVTVKSPTGLESTPVLVTQRTGDIVPNPVTNLTLVEVRANDVLYSYEMPTENPQCAVSFKATYVDLTDSEGLNDMIYKDELLSCTNYLIMVQTISPSGLSSAPENITARTDVAIPTAPKNFTVIANDQDSATLEWLRPQENDRCVTAYKLTWTDGTTPQTEDIPFASTVSPFKIDHLLTGLTPCTPYEASVVALSDVGDSPSVSTSFTTQC